MKKSYVVALMVFCALGLAEPFAVSTGAQATFYAPQTIVRIVNTQRTLCAVQKQDKALVITGLRPGEAIVYYWDINNTQHVLKVAVSGRVYALAGATAAKTKGKYELYFKVDPKNDTPVNKRMLVNKLAYTTELGEYGLDLLMEYKNIGVTEKSNKEQLDTLRVRLNRGNNFLLIGDDVVQYTALTAPYLSVQGARAGFFLGNTRWDIFAGRRPGEYWGDIVKYDSYQDRQERTALSGARIVADFKPFELGLTRVQRSGAENDQSVYYRNAAVTAVDAKYRYEAYTFTAESGTTIAKENQSKATQAQVAYEGETTGYRFTVMDIAAQYNSVTDFLAYQGARGFSFWGRYTPLRALGLTASYDKYVQRYDQEYYSVTNKDYDVDRRSLRLSFSGLPFMQMSVQSFRNLGFLTTMSGSTLTFDQVSLWREYLVYFYEFSPWSFTYDGQDTKIYRYTSGLSSQVASWCALRLQQENELRYYDIQDSTNPHGFTGVVQLGDFSVPWTTIRYNLGYWYQRRENAQGTLDSRRTAIRVRIQQLIGKNLFWYLNGVNVREQSKRFEYADVDQVGYYYKDELVQSEVSGGFSYSF
jgi:hypothetical protein